MLDEISLYDAVGGMPYFESLVDRFYEGVAADPVLRPLYPEADLTGARRRLSLFLAQYWGGPRTYDDCLDRPAAAGRRTPPGLRRHGRGGDAEPRLTDRRVAPGRPAVSLSGGT